MGDTARVIMSKAVIQEILDKNLVEQCVSSINLIEFNRSLKSLLIDNRPVWEKHYTLLWRSLLKNILTTCRTCAERAWGKTQKSGYLLLKILIDTCKVPTSPLIPKMPVLL